MKTDITEKIVDYENGNMPDSDIPQFFCDLANAGLVGQLQGSYQRMLSALHRNMFIGLGNLDGKEHWCVAPPFNDVRSWVDTNGGCEAVACGCWVEPDGQCQCGNPSWLRYWNLI